MNLILSDRYLDSDTRINLALNNGFSPSFVNLDGLSFEEIKESLLFYKNRSKEKEAILTIISSDERLLLFDDIFDINNIYLYSAPFINKLCDCTSKELRPAHNLFKMYIAGDFLLPSDCI